MICDHLDEHPQAHTNTHEHPHTRTVGQVGLYLMSWNFSVDPICRIHLMYALHIAFEHRRMLACLDMQCLPGGSLHSYSHTHAMSWQPHKIKRFTAYMNVCVCGWRVCGMGVSEFVCVCQTHMMQSNRQYEVHTCVKQVIPFWGFWIINATKNVRSSIYCCCVLNCILHCALVIGITAHFTHTATHTHMHRATQTGSFDAIAIWIDFNKLCCKSDKH